MRHISGQNVDGSSGATQQVSETAADTPKQLRHNVRELRIVADKPVTLLPAKLLVVVKKKAECPKQAK